MPPMPDALAHLTVLELCSTVAGGYAGKCLADLGADVIKIEPPTGDPVRALGPFLDDREGPLTGIPFVFGNTSKRSVVIDVARPEGAALVRDLARAADLLIEDGAPGALDALGLGVDTLRAAHPGLIVVSITPYGQTGPRRAWRGTDLTTHAVSGIAMTTPLKVGDSNTVPPLRPGGRHADYVSGMAGAALALVAVHGRRRSGRGTHVDLSMQETLASFTRMDVAFRTYDPGNVTGMLTGVDSRHGEAQSLWGLVPCKDGSFAFQASEDYQWKGFMRALGSPAWAERPEFQDPYERGRRWNEIHPLLCESTMRMTKAEIYHTAQAEHVPVFPCYTTAEAYHDEQIESREFFVTVQRPETGPVEMPGPPVRHERTPVRYRRPWPAIGEHTDAILGPRLGPERLAALRERGVVA